MDGFHAFGIHGDCPAVPSATGQNPLTPAGERIALGNARLLQGDASGALAEYDEALKQDVNSAEAHQGRGVALARLGQTRQAVAAASEAIRINPQSAAAYRNRGRDQASLRAFSRAIADFTQAIRLEPTHAGAYCDRAAIYNRQGKFGLAFADADAAIRLSPDLALAYCARGFAGLGLGRQRVFTFWRRGNAQARQADFERALADFDEALRRNPGAPDCLYGRNLVLERLGLRK